MKFLDLRALCLIFAFWSYSAVAYFYPISGGMINQVEYVTTAAATTTLTKTSKQIQVLEGATTQIVKLPDATTLPIDWWFDVVNNSTGVVTVNDNAGGLVTTVSSGQIGRFFLKARASAAGTWKKNTNVSSADLSNYYLKSEFIATSAGSGDAGKPVKTNGSGLVDPSFFSSLSSGLNQLTGDVTAGPGTGSQASTVALVGGKTATAVAQSVTDTTAATASNTNSTIVKRDGSGNFAATTITANITGNVTGALTGNASTASAFAADPTDCAGGTKATGIAANGNLTCTAVSLTADVSGTLPAGNGGTGQTTIALAFASFFQSSATTLGDILYGGASGTPTRLAGDTSNTKKFLTGQSSSGVAAAPTWGTIATGDVAFPAASAIAVGANKDIDWNVLVTNGGVYTKTLAVNTTFTFSNPIAGQTIVVRLTNTASNFTVTWSDARLKWPSGTTPTQTVGAKSDVYTFVYDGVNIYGNAVQNF